jgi:CHAD domain-containing protein
MDNGEVVVGIPGSTVAVAPIGWERMVHERVRQFMKLLPEVLNSASSESVHDLRVWSRRLQQVLMAMLPATEEPRAAGLINSIRQARRALSGWRDCDVLIGLIDRRLRRLHDPDEQMAWRVVRDYVAIMQQKEITQGQRRLAKRRLFTLAQRVDNLLKAHHPDVSPDPSAATGHLDAAVVKFIKTASSAWHVALTSAAESDDLADVHELRIKTKKLRYWIELARDLGDKDLLAPLNRLKWLQDRLGEWHDRAELARVAIEAIARGNLLFVAPRPAVLLLRRLAREVRSETVKVKSLLAVVKVSGEISQLDAWISRRDSQSDNA